jgi:hypothetical protein
VPSQFLAQLRQEIIATVFHEVFGQGGQKLKGGDQSRWQPPRHHVVTTAEDLDFAYIALER